MHLPVLAYIGHALLNYTLTNPGGSITPRGTGYYDIFGAGVLTFHPASVLTLPAPNPAYIPETGPLNISLPAYKVDILSGNDYFKLRSGNMFELDTTAAGKAVNSGALVHFRAGGFIRINAYLGQILQGKGDRDMKFGETDFWEPITIDTSDPELAWLNFRMIISQGRILVDKATGKAYGFELRLFSPVSPTEIKKRYAREDVGLIQ